MQEKCLDKDVESQKVHFKNGIDKLGEKCKIYLYESNKCVITDRDKKRETLPKLKCQDQIDYFNTECQVIVKYITRHQLENSCCIKLKNFECVEYKVKVIKNY